MRVLVTMKISLLTSKLPRQQLLNVPCQTIIILTYLNVLHSTYFTIIAL